MIIQSSNSSGPQILSFIVILSFSLSKCRNLSLHVSDTGAFDPDCAVDSTYIYGCAADQSCNNQVKVLLLNITRYTKETYT